MLKAGKHVGWVVALTVLFVATPAYAITVQCAPGGNYCQGGSGNDTIWGTNTPDRMGGNGGNDTLYGKPASDVLRGGAGEDTLRGGTGKDRFYGGTERDEIHAVDGAADLINCGDGEDIAFVEKVDAVSEDCEIIALK
jgi:hypothetical protein